MKVSVACLGGVGEIGMNMYVYETEKYALIVDCGVKFARSDDPGIDLIIPDFSYIETIIHKQILLVATHGHEDHIGAIPYLIKRFPSIMAGANRYTYALLDYKLKEHDISLEKIYIDEKVPFEWGDFEVTLYPISHSIHGTNAVHIKIRDGFKFLHISDYKVDFSPVTGSDFPLKDFIDIADMGIDCFLADSTNVTKKGFTDSEYTVIKNLDKVFKEAEGRIFFTTFASNVERLQTVFNLAEKHGRYIALEGSSISKNIDIARKHSKLRINESLLVSRKQIERLDDNKIVVIGTGSQGEGASVITKISQDDYSNIKVRPTDLFIFSSRTIPGNEQWVIRVINNIYTKGGSVITGEKSPIHVSGHVAEEDAKMMIKLIKPTYLVPVHGEVHHLSHHRDIALKAGMDNDYILSFYAGQKLIFEDGIFVSREEVPADKMFVDTNLRQILTYDELKARKRLATEGAVIVFIKNFTIENIEKDNIIVSFIGFSLEKEYEAVLKDILIEQNEPYTKENIYELMEKKVKHFFKKRFSKKPIISIELC